MTDEAEAKSLTFEVKADGESGEFAATFATFNAVDAHDDVTRPGAFKTGAEVLVGAYNHETGFLPVGKGTIHTDDTRAWIEGSFNLNTQIGRDTYESVKHAGSLMEWSYIYKATEYEFGDFAGKQVRFLNAIDVWSVDPVLKGAGVGTGTLAIKSARSGMGMDEHVGAARAALQNVTERVKSLADLRADEGRTLGSSTVEAVSALLAAMDEAKALLGPLRGESTESKAEIDLRAEVMRAEARRAEAYAEA